MSSFIELKFISYVSPMLERFKWVVPSQVANFRCNVCGDSQKNKHKSRGYFYIVKTSDMFCFKCQNCGASMSFKKYIKLYFPQYYKEMRLDEFASSNSSGMRSESRKKPDMATIIERVKVDIKASSKLLTPLSELSEDHMAVKYCRGRLIPESNFNRLYYTPDYGAWISQYLPKTEKRYPNDERLVMLMKDETGEVFGAQGRALKATSIRYITVKFDESRPKLFGLDTVDKTKPIFLMEGVIDSMFIPNSVAICGGDVGASVSALGVDPKNIVVVLDNEPRSKDTARRMELAIKLGCTICIWGIDTSLKDVNEMVKGGLSPKKILEHISQNVFRGSKALVKLKFWKKV